ncbi:Txe/YoeB family addiction module toxin [Sphingomonas paucimobilis]|uniref:Txe/YoeB family addiction module toxin n=1 Tax=Sphingomonas paucimobilis TaxID=13689 RepID=UPI0028D85B06|nr:Txe/YoeB family addiction module toxin [Sphingomonas paucimobilis]
MTFRQTAWDDYRHWPKHDAKLCDKLHALIKECRRHPFKGTGKPEPLGGNLSGWWSRRISHEHRLVYRVAGSGDEQVLQVAQCCSLSIQTGCDCDGRCLANHATPIISEIAVQPQHTVSVISATGTQPDRHTMCDI